MCLPTIDSPSEADTDVVEVKSPEDGAGVADDATEDTPRSLTAPTDMTDAATSGNRSPKDATGVTDVALVVVLSPDDATSLVTCVDPAFTTPMSDVEFAVIAPLGDTTGVTVVEVEIEVVRPCEDVVGVRDVDVTIARSAEEFTDVNTELTLVDSVGMSEVVCKLTRVGVGVKGVLGTCPLSLHGNTLLPPGRRPLILYL